jgi:glycosyltransferase involved in cell wall biosynthesis
MLFVGRLDHQKGIDVLVKSIQHLETRAVVHAQKMRFRICGSGPFVELVREFASRRKNVDYLGYVSEEQLQREYMNSDVLLMPSRRETFGIVALEAMASGLPVLTTDIPGPRAFVDSRIGMLVKPSNHVSLAEGLLSFFEIWKDDPTRTADMGQRARELCVAKYSWQRIVHLLGRMIREVHSMKQS